MLGDVIGSRRRRDWMSRKLLMTAHLPTEDSGHDELQHGGKWQKGPMETAQR